MAVDGRFKTKCDQWKQTSGCIVLRKGRLEPANDESKHSSIILHPTRAAGAWPHEHGHDWMSMGKGKDMGMSALAWAGA